MKAKKSLGQNFFINKNLGNHIIEKVKETNTNTVIEIGPGLGFFTQLLVQSFNEVIVVEKDTSLAQNLRVAYPQIEVINEDFLNLDLNIFKEKDLSYFGSLPYNVSKPIIKKIVEHSTFKNSAYFIVQKEVAQKYVYQKPYNSLALITCIYAHIKKVFDISPESFRPKPKVNSSLISVTPSNRNIPNQRELKELITMSFKQPRKNLRNNLKGTKYSNIIVPYEEKRPSDLSLEEYINILNPSN